MKVSYEVLAVVRQHAKPLLKELGEGWKLKVKKNPSDDLYHPELVFKDVLTVYPVSGGFRAQIKGHPEWNEFGSKAANAVREVFHSFRESAKKLGGAVDAAYAAADILEEKPYSPFREALRTLCGAEPPAFVRGYHSHDYTDAENEKLQDWCSMHARPHWATGLGLIEAAELIVQGAVENSNIEKEPQ